MSVCARCGATFSCAMADPGDGQPCWCTQLPPAVPVPGADATGAACWCPDCLKAHIAAKLSVPPGV
ncbi:cysteine-rich CWC family protein [Oxalobacteraceae bacterium]|nr:cysteine-rich CWC family protein [Oxalobacteraceae bacterium]